MKMLRAALSAAVAIACAATGSLTTAQASSIESLTIPVIQAPSLGNFLPPIIKSEHLDQAHGLDLTFKEEPVGTYRTDFASGRYPIGGSGTILTDVALLSTKGVAVQYLFNVFDFWGAIVTPERGSVKTVRDLNGHTLGASLATDSFVMFKSIAKRNGVDLDALRAQNANTPELVPLALSGRVDAVELWEPAYSILIDRDRTLRTFDLASEWTAVTGDKVIPYLGVAAHSSWVNTHAETVKKLYDTYQAAAAFIKRDPSKAAAIISAGTSIPTATLAKLLASKRLGLDVYPARAQAKAITTELNAAKQIDYLRTAPPANTLLYQGKL